MTERYSFDPNLQRKALAVVERLEKAGKEKRNFATDIEAIFVFSGPGTYNDRLKPGQEERQRWMDRDRIRAGAAVVRDITARKKTHEAGKRVRVNEITKEDILHMGPYLVYNGIPIENEVFRQAIDSCYCKIPKEKIVIIDEVLEEDGSSHPIRHTGDQFKSFYQAIANPHSQLYGVTTVALIAQPPDFVRHPFYAKKYNDEHEAHGGTPLTFWAYSPRSRNDVRETHLSSELERLVLYAPKGDLALEPAELLM